MLFSFFIAQAQTYHIYRIYDPDSGLAGAQIINDISSDRAVFGRGDSYISEIHQVAFEITAASGFGFSGTFAHLYIFEVDEEQTEFYVNIGILSPRDAPLSAMSDNGDGEWSCDEIRVLGLKGEAQPFIIEGPVGPQGTRLGELQGLEPVYNNDGELTGYRLPWSGDKN